MPVRNIKRIRPKIWIPPTYSSNYKFTVEREDETVDDITNILTFLEVEDGVTNKIGRFEFQIYDPNEEYKAIWTGKETVRYYKDYAQTATTLRFRGKTEKVSYQGNKLKVTGRSESLVYMDVTVTQSYSNQAPDTILKDLVSTYSTGFTVTNVEPSTEQMTVNWTQKPFWDCVEELCQGAEFDAYVDADKDWHFFDVGSRDNTGEAIVHESNLLDIDDFADDYALVKNRVIVYGAKTDGVQHIATAEEDGIDTAFHGVKEIIMNNDNVTDYTQAQELADATLEQNKDPTVVGNVKSILLATVQPGERIQISSPANNLPPDFYLSSRYLDRLELENGMLTTTVTINKEPPIISDIFKTVIQNANQQKQTSDNPHEMRFSYVFLFDESDGTHVDTEVVNGVLTTTAGNSVGNWVSDSRTTASDVNQVYLIMVGKLLGDATIEVSADNGVNYQEMTNKELITMSTAKGNVIRMKVSFTNADSEIDSLSLMYTLD